MTLITDFVDARIIDKHSATELDTLFKDADAKPETTPLKILFRFFEGKLVKQHTNSGWHAVLSPSPNVNQANSDTGQTKTMAGVFIDILYKHDLINQLVYNKISSLSYSHIGYYGLIYLIAELNKFYYNFTIEKQLEFVELFGKDDLPFRNNMLSESSKKKLLRDIKGGKVGTYLDFLNIHFAVP